MHSLYWICLVVVETKNGGRRVGLAFSVRYLSDCDVIVMGEV